MKSADEIAAALKAAFGPAVLAVTQDEYGNVRVCIQENSLYTREFGVSKWSPVEETVAYVGKELGYTQSRNTAGPSGHTGWTDWS
jgi:hypothetical protein